MRSVLELFIALALIALNGVFALSELAVVSARKSRLKTMVEARRPGAKTALALAEEPGRFLSTVQIGITLVGILAGAFSGAALSERFDEVLEGWGVATRVAEPLAYVLVIGFITYLSVVIGELVPKNLALKNPEGIACTLAPPMALLSRVAGPVVWFLDASTKVVFRLLGGNTEFESAITDEESRDAWDNDFFIQADGGRSPVLVAAGRDKEEGTADDFRFPLDGSRRSVPRALQVEDFEEKKP